MQRRDHSRPVNRPLRRIPILDIIYGMNGDQFLRLEDLSHPCNNGRAWNTHWSKVLSAEDVRAHAERKPSATHILVENDTVREDITQVLCERRFPRACRASGGKQRHVRAAFGLKYNSHAPDADEDNAQLWLGRCVSARRTHADIRILDGQLVSVATLLFTSSSRSCEREFGLLAFGLCLVAVPGDSREMKRDRMVGSVRLVGTALDQRLVSRPVLEGI